jgi:hypothetical protein
MRSDIIHAAMATWATRELPARLHADQVAKLLNCTCEDVAILSASGTLKPLGKPRPNSVKLFSTIELFTLIADRDWLDEATKTISQHWRRKNARRNGGASDWGGNKDTEAVPARNGRSSKSELVAHCEGAPDRLPTKQ